MVENATEKFTNPEIYDIKKSITDLEKNKTIKMTTDIKKAINPQISKDFEDWKKFLIENKYINKQEEIIYKPQ